MNPGAFPICRTVRHNETMSRRCTISPKRWLRRGPVIGNDGWESVATDLIGIHDYDDPERIGKRYGLNEIEARLFQREQPGGRMLVVDGEVSLGQPIVLTEFGGIALSQ